MGETKKVFFYLNVDELTNKYKVLMWSSNKKSKSILNV